MSFFVLTLLLSVPFYGFGFLTPVEMLPGLPSSALMVISPALVAVLLTGRRRGKPGVRELLRIQCGVRRRTMILPFLVALLMKPLLFAASYGVLHLRRIPIPGVRSTWCQPVACWCSFSYPHSLRNWDGCAMRTNGSNRNQGP